MTDTKNKLVRELNQIKARQTAIVDRLEALKETAPPESIPELEIIEADAWRVIIGLEETAKKINGSLIAEIERNTILFRIRTKPFSGQKIGAIWVG